MIKKISLSILFCFLAFSCRNNTTENERPLIRLVDANGNYRPVQKFVPLYNAQLQEQQNQQINQKNIANSSRVNLDDQAQVASKELFDPEPYDNFGGNYGSSQNPLIERDIATQAVSKLGPVFESTPRPLSTTPTPNVKYSFGNKKTAVNKKAVQIEKPLNTTATTTATEKKVYKPTQENKTLSGIFVKLGSYDSESEASLILEQSKKISSGFIKKTIVGKKDVYQILLGPVENKNEAVILLVKTKNLGFKNALVTKIE